MKFETALLAVRDIEVSKAFYQSVLGQKISLDLGRSAFFEGGFALQQDFAWMADVPKATVLHQSHNMELYFSVEDFDEFLDRLSRQPEIELVHQPKMHEWHQRAVRFYDPDWHVIEVGESMAQVARNLLQQGYSVEQVAQMIQHPVSFVEKQKKGME